MTKLKDVFSPMVIFNVLCLVLIVLLFVYMPTEKDTKYINSVEYQNDLQKLKEMSGINDSGENVLNALMASRSAKHEATCKTTTYYNRGLHTIKTCNESESIYTDSERFAKIVYDKVHNANRYLCWGVIGYIFIALLIGDLRAASNKGWKHKPYLEMAWPLFIFAGLLT